MAKEKRPTRESDARSVANEDRFVSQFQVDPEALNPDYHYMWVETSCMGAPTQSVSNAIRAGYEPVKLSDMAQFSKSVKLIQSIRGVKNNEEDYVRQGDQILMYCPKKLYQDARKRERKLARDQQRNIDTAELQKQIGAPVFVSENRGSRTFERAAAVDKAFADDDE